MIPNERAFGKATPRPNARAKFVEMSVELYAFLFVESAGFARDDGGGVIDVALFHLFIRDAKGCAVFPIAGRGVGVAETKHPKAIPSVKRVGNQIRWGANPSTAENFPATYGETGSRKCAATWNCEARKSRLAWVKKFSASEAQELNILQFHTSRKPLACAGKRWSCSH